MVDQPAATDGIYFTDLLAQSEGGFIPATGIGAGWRAFEHTLGS